MFLFILTDTIFLIFEMLKQLSHASHIAQITVAKMICVAECRYARYRTYL
jgi:hypothetical protein